MRERRGPVPITLPHRLPDRGPWLDCPPDPAPERCHRCGAPLQLRPVGPSEPDRLIGVCGALQCGEVVTFRRLEGRLIVVERRRR
jgi:hypothetical protein